MDNFRTSVSTLLRLSRDCTAESTDAAAAETFERMKELLAEIKEFVERTEFVLTAKTDYMVTYHAIPKEKE